MMNGKAFNNLIVIENGKLNTYLLDNKNVWEVGRPTKDTKPDIPCHSGTVSRRHGRFENMDGIWFYLDNNGKNGTVYNDRHIDAGRNGRIKPIMLSDGDVLIFGGGEHAAINSRTIWSMFSTRYYSSNWSVVETADKGIIVISDGNNVTRCENPVKGTVIEQEQGIAIYMGNITYLLGEARLINDI
ncbi:MAG: FHA domain-containing protein [Lachnospiraceae bacterium]|nr:FHA domain-containing protein [Lachnospiraceae bacterium]